MSETWKGLYAGVVLNLVVAALLNNDPFFSTPCARVWLVTLGATNELLGVLLVASPELIPYVKAIAFWIKAQRDWLYLQRIRPVLRRVFHLPALTHQVVVGATVPFESSMGIPTIGTRPREGAPIDAIVAFLSAEVERMRTSITELEREFHSHTAKSSEELKRVRTELTSETREALQALAERNLRLRLLGLMYVAAGLVLSWVGNLYWM
jgi:hypothetical protein